MAKWWLMIFGHLLPTLCDLDEICTSMCCDREDQSNNWRSYGEIKEPKMNFDKKLSW